MRWYGLWLVGVLALASCARNQSGWSQSSSSASEGASSKSPGAIVTPAPVGTGRISSVNPTARFVVVTYPLGVSLPSVERQLNVYRGGLKVAELKVTGPSRDLNTVADITAGECQPGDEVREN